MGREVIAKRAQTEHQQGPRAEAAEIRFKLAKFEGIYNAYN